MYNTEIINVLEKMIEELGGAVAVENAIKRDYSSLNENDIAILSVKKRLLLASYQHFVEFAFPLAEKGAVWINAPHHPLMIHTLQKVIDGRISRLILNVPPRFSKTILTTTLLNAYGMVKNPTLTRNMTVSFNESVLTDEGKKVRDLMDTPEFQRIFSTEISRDTQSKTDFAITKGAATKLITTFGQITGNSCGGLEEDRFDEYGDLLTPTFMGFLAIDD